MGFPEAKCHVSFTGINAWMRPVKLNSLDKSCGVIGFGHYRGGWAMNLQCWQTRGFMNSGAVDGNAMAGQDN
jgi:hypothetical protein